MCPAASSLGFLFRWTLCLPNEQAEDARAFLLSASHSGWEEEEEEDNLRLRLYLASEEDALMLGRRAGLLWPQAAVFIDTIPNEDWTRSWREFFTPVLIGETFAIIPPWMAEKNPYPERHVLVIEPAMAFGTGHHATTAMCLAALAGLFQKGAIRPGENFLDLGTGTGILGIGLTRLGLRGLGVDIDPLAVQNCQVNKSLNNVGDEFSARECGLDGAGDGPFQCIVSNILAGPLVDMAPDIVRRLAPGGSLVLSGILTSQAGDVRQAYTALGLPQPDQLEEQEWTALVFTAPGD